MRDWVFSTETQAGRVVGYGMGSANSFGSKRSAEAPRAAQSSRPPMSVPTTELASERAGA